MSVRARDRGLAIWTATASIGRLAEETWMWDSLGREQGTALTKVLMGILLSTLQAGVSDQPSGDEIAMAGCCCTATAPSWVVTITIPSRQMGAKS